MRGGKLDFCFKKLFNRARLLKGVIFSFPWRGLEGLIFLLRTARTIKKKKKGVF